MPQGYDGLPPSYIGLGSPLTPNLGLSLAGMDPIVAENFWLIDVFAAGGGGTSVFVNSVSVSNPNFNDTTPAAAANHLNVTWHVSGSNVSASIDTSSIGAAGNTGDIQFNNAGVFDATDNFTWDVNGDFGLAVVSTTNGAFFDVANNGANVQMLGVGLELDISGTVTNRATIIDAFSSVTGTINNLVGIRVAAIAPGSIGQYIGIDVNGPSSHVTTSIGLRLSNFSNSGDPNSRAILVNEGIVELVDGSCTFALGSNPIVSGNDVTTGFAFDISNISPTVIQSVIIPDGTSAPALAATPIAGNALSGFNPATGTFSFIAVGTGTVTTFSAGDLSPLFTSNVANPTTTPALTFALTNAAGGTVFGRNAATAGAPSYTNSPHLGIPGTSTGLLAIASSTASGLFTLTVPASSATPTLTLPTTSNVLAGQFAGDNVIYTSTLQVASAAGTLTPSLLTQTQKTFLAGPTSGAAATPTFRALATADLPAGTGTVTSVALATGAGATDALYTISGSPITTSGTITETLNTQTANFGFFGPTSGGAASPTFRAIVAADIPSGANLPLWSNLQNAAGALTLANAGNATTFNQTSAVNWTWANTTAATSSASSSSPIFNINGRVFSSAVDTLANISLQTLLATPNNKTITNISETAGSIVTLTVGAGHGFLQGMWITLTGLTTGTWLNSQNSRITSTAATTISFLDPTSHGTQASHADTGTAIQIPNSELTIAGSGTAANTRVIFPANGVNNANDGTGGFGFSGQANNTGFGLANAAQGGLSIFTVGSTSAITGLSVLKWNTAATQAVPTLPVFTLQYGDNSDGNTAAAFIANLANCSISIQGLRTTSFANPIAMVGNAANAVTATSGAAIGLGVGYHTNSTTSFNFAPTSGTATWNAFILKYTVNQTGGANGNATGLLVNAVETAVGGTHVLFELQAGTTGGTREFAITNTGTITNYAATSLVGQGVASQIATIDLTAQTAAITATNLTASAPRTGMYQISWSATITTAASTSSVLGGANGFRVGFTSPTDSVAKTVVAGNSVTSAANTTGTAVAGSYVVYAKTGTAITYAFDYTSVGGTPMAFELHIRLEAM